MAKFKLVFVGEEVATLATFVDAFKALHGKVQDSKPRTHAEMDNIIDIEMTCISMSSDDGFSGKMDALQAANFADKIGLLNDPHLVDGVEEPDEAIVRTAFEEAVAQTARFDAGECRGCGGHHDKAPQSTGDPLLDLLAAVGISTGDIRASGGPGFTVLELGRSPRDDSRRF